MKIRKLTPNSKIRLGVILIVLIVLLQGGFAFRQMNKLSQLTDDMYNHPLAVSKALLEIESHINAMHRAIKDVAIAHTPEALEVAMSALEEHEEHIQIDFLIIYDKYLGDRNQIDHAIALLKGSELIRDEVIDLNKTGSYIAALQVTTGKGADHMNKIFDAIDPMIDFADNKAMQFLRESQEQQTTSMVLLILSIILFSGSAYFVLRSTIHTFKNSEQKYANLIHNMREGVSIGSAEGELLYVNPSFAAMLGYERPSELIGSQAIDLYADPKARAAIFERLMTEGFIDNMKIDLIKKDSSLVHVLVSIIAKKDEEGHVLEIESTVSDITERLRSEAILRNQQELIENTARLTKIGGWEVNLETGDSSFTDETYRIHGLTPDDPKPSVEEGMTFYPSEVRPVIQSLVDEAIEEHRPYDIELPFIIAGDESRWVRTIGEVEIKNGKAVRLYGAIQDITENKEAEVEKENALLEAKQANEVKDQFIANISHEIRTPLNSILGFSDLFKQRYSNDIQVKDKVIFDYITDSSERLMHTVDSILNMSILKSGTVSIHKEVVNLNQMTGLIVNNFRVVAKKKNLSLDIVESELPAKVFVDINCINSAIGNLTDNAIKYTEKGGVTFTLEVIEEQVTLSISDTGIGISEDYKQRVFEPYTQESEGFTKEYQGVGLGLAITKQFLDLNDVILVLETEKNVGTTFRLTFPKYKDENHG